MLLNCLFYLRFEIDESQKNMLEQSLRYNFSIISSNNCYIYPRLTEIIVYCLEQPKTQRSAYIYKMPREKK